MLVVKLDCDFLRRRSQVTERYQDVLIHSQFEQWQTSHHATASHDLYPPMPLSLA